MFDVDLYQSEKTMSVSRAWPMLVAGALLSLPAIAQEGGRPPEGGGRDRRPPNPLMQALDADGDGELSAKEIENATVALKSLDKNKDGKLAGEEIRPAFGGGFPAGVVPVVRVAVASSIRRRCSTVRSRTTRTRMAS